VYGFHKRSESGGEREMVFEDEQLIFYFHLRRFLLLRFSFLLNKYSRPG
jgi:hypothetical protein